MRNTFLLLAILFSSSITACNGQTKTLVVGDPVPEFVLSDQEGKRFDIGDYIGKDILVIYFYPKDESMVCTKEACAFRDDYSAFTHAGAKVIGINDGSVNSHEQFARNHQLPFTLLSDPGNKVLKAFGVKNMLFFTGRETFVVDRKGKIVLTYNSFSKGSAHKDEALKVVKSLSLSEKTN
jgi:thioredoxin-dependent peroxiredoxin